MSCAKKQKNNELLEWIAWGRAELSRAGIEEDQEECERILMKLLSCQRSEIYLREHELIESGVRERFLAIVEKRLQRIPLAYLLNEADFWQETLYVDERCLIPRPETEILVEQIILEVTKNKTGSFGNGHEARIGNGKGNVTVTDKRHGHRCRDRSTSFLDIGTGSGAIAVALLREFPDAHGTLLDISEEALEVARINVEKYGLQDRARLVKGNCFGGLASRHPETRRAEGSQDEILRFAQNDELHGEQFCWIVSNPPYLSEQDWNGVQEELKFEPRRALDGGKDGLDFYRKIIAGAHGHLISGGRLALEVGQGQADTVSKWLQTAGYDNIQRFKDHLGIERVITARKAESIRIENNKAKHDVR